MPTRPLPDRPDLDQLRRRARELQRSVTAGVPEARALVAEHLAPPPDPGAPLPLHLAQLALARHHGFPSWSAMVAQVRRLAARRRDPVTLTADPPGERLADPVEQVLRHAVLTFGPPDGQARWSRAARLLAEHPGLTASSVPVAAVAGDRDALARHLADDPDAADREGGPLAWPPLLWLTYSRLAAVGAGGDPVGCAQLLLTAGADPDAGFCWEGLPTPFTALTGVFGSGRPEQPTHPDADRLVRALLAAGADPNDGQALYNRMFRPEDDHLRLLLAGGLGRGDGGPWRRALPDLTDSPAQLLDTQLAWAVVHGFGRRVRLLARTGLDLDRPLDVGRLPLTPDLTPLALAQRSGRGDIVALLLALGAAEESDAESLAVAALLRGDRVAVAGLGPDLPRLRRRYPSLVLRAAVADQPEGVRLLVEQGFDVDALGRQDVPLEQPWETALHHAAGEGKRELAALLLELGADPGVRDARFGATPLGWAEHLGQPALVALLAPLTRRTEPPSPREGGREARPAGRAVRPSSGSTPCARPSTRTSPTPRSSTARRRRP